MWWLAGLGLTLIILMIVFIACHRRIGKYLMDHPMAGIDYTVVDEAALINDPFRYAGYPRFHGIAFQNYSSWLHYIKSALTLPEMRLIRGAMTAWIVSYTLLIAFFPTAIIILNHIGAAHK